MWVKLKTRVSVSKDYIPGNTVRWMMLENNSSVKIYVRAPNS